MKGVGFFFFSNAFSASIAMIVCFFFVLYLICRVDDMD